MKKLILFISLCILSFTLSNCQDVIEVELNTAPPKLVIEASLLWKKGTTGNLQTVKLSTTSGFYEQTKPMVSGANIFVQDNENTYTFVEETDQKGVYICRDFVPKLNQTYTLTVQNNGQTYTATETFLPCPTITRIEQTNDAGFGGNRKQIKAFFNDSANQFNYYLFKFNFPRIKKSTYSVLEDQLFDGNEFFSLTQEEKLETGDQIEISHHGISKNYFNYMNLLINIAGSSSGAPFQAPPVTLKGNIINQTKPENFPLGYFSLSEIDTRTYTVQ